MNKKKIISMVLVGMGYVLGTFSAYKLGHAKGLADGTMEAAKEKLYDVTKSARDKALNKVRDFTQKEE